MQKQKSILLVLCWGILFAKMAWGAPLKEDYFPLTEGNTWKYHWVFGTRSDDYTTKVVKQEVQLDGSLQYLVETATATQSFQEWYSKPKGWISIHKTSYPKNNVTGDYLPARLYLENPLRSGDSWAWKGSGILGIKIEESSKVFHAETLTVPAGKFTALKVETDLVQNGARVKRTCWYANGVGLIKTLTQSSGMESTSELTDYSLANGALPKKM